MKFNTDALKPADVLAVRREGSEFSTTIRAILGSWTNHNSMVNLIDLRWWIGEAIYPKSQLTELTEYERQMNEGEIYVRVLRVPGLSDDVRMLVNDRFLATKLGKKYPLSVGRLWVFRVVNKLPWKIEGEWCTRIVWDPFEDIVPGVFDRPPDGAKKKNPTPRTVENRLVAGVFQDVTNQVLE